MRKIFAMLLAGISVFVLSNALHSTALASATQPVIKLNGNVVSFTDVQPTVINDRTYVPFRKLLESLGATVTWDDQTVTGIAIKNGLEIRIPLGSKTIKVQGHSLNMDVPVIQQNDRILIPLRFVSQALGTSVNWLNDSAGTVELNQSVEDIKKQLETGKSGDQQVSKEQVPILIEWLKAQNATLPDKIFTTSDTTAAASGSTITLDKNTTYQTIWGFGAAANHPVNELKTNYSSSVQSQILDKLFGTDSSNAGLSIVRLEINPYTAIQDSVQTTFMPADGVLDWNTDLHQRWFSQEAKNRGMNQFYAVPWSPPGWMKGNGSPNHGGHLKSTHYDTFASYMKTYVDHYRNTFGFNIKWVSIQNEPDLATPYASAQYTNSELDQVAAKVADAIHSLNQGVLVGAPEGSNRTASNNYMLNFSTSTRNILDFVAVHDYGTYANVNDFGKPLMSTEVSEFQHPNDPTITDGLKWANMIAADLKRGERGWLYWWAVNPASNGTGEGLINLGANNTYSVNKRLYVMGQFSRYFSPDDTRILAASNSSDLVSIAGKNSSGRASVVIINNSSSEITTTISGLTLSNVAARRTSATEDLEKLSDLSVTNGSITVTLPGKSVTSYIEY